MTSRRLWIFATIIALVVIGGFVLSVPHTRDSGRTPLLSVVPIVPTVTLHDSFKKGLHTITGSLTAPNACAVVSATATFSAENILVAISMPEDTGVCLQVPTKTDFQTSVNAPAHLPITATVNGAVATTTVS